MSAEHGEHKVYIPIECPSGLIGFMTEEELAELEDGESEDKD